MKLCMSLNSEISIDEGGMIMIMYWIRLIQVNWRGFLLLVPMSMSSSNPLFSSQFVSIPIRLVITLASSLTLASQFRFSGERMILTSHRMRFKSSILLLGLV